MSYSRACLKGHCAHHYKNTASRMVVKMALSNMPLDYRAAVLGVSTGNSEGVTSDAKCETFRIGAAETKVPGKKRQRLQFPVCH